MQGFVDIKLTFFLGYDRFLVARSKLGHVFFKNAFLLPCTGNSRDMSDIGVGKTAAHEWLFAGS
jgi:hypothetical protein